MEPIKINLATFEYQDKRLSYPVMLVTALIVLFISIISVKSGINAQGEIREYENRLAAKEQNIIKRQQIKRDTITRLDDDEIATLKKDIDFINNLIMTDTYPYDRLFDSFELCIPQGIALVNFDLSNDRKTVDIKGEADTMNDITVFLNKLDNSRIYKNNKLLNLTVSREDNQREETDHMDDITFEVECSISPDQVWAKAEGG